MFTEIIGLQQYLSLIPVSDSKLVIVDFNATWCQPCKLLEPRLTSLQGDKVVIFSVDADADRELDDEQQLMPIFQVSKLPAIFLVKNKQVIPVKDLNTLETEVAKLL
jgi:thioredoxin 1